MSAPAENVVDLAQAREQRRDERPVCPHHALSVFRNLPADTQNCVLRLMESFLRLDAKRRT